MLGFGYWEELIRLYAHGDIAEEIGDGQRDPAAGAGRGFGFEDGAGARVPPLDGVI